MGASTGLCILGPGDNTLNQMRPRFNRAERAHHGTTNSGGSEAARRSSEDQAQRLSKAEVLLGVSKLPQGDAPTVILIRKLQIFLQPVSPFP